MARTLMPAGLVDKKTAVANGSTATLKLDNTFNERFQLDRLTVHAFDSTTGAKLPVDGDPNVSLNTLAAAGNVTVQIRIGPDSVFTQPVQLTHILDPQFAWQRIMPIIKPNVDIQLDITNSSGSTLDFSALAWGGRIIRDN